MGEYQRLKEVIKQAKKRRKTTTRWAEYLNRSVPAIYGPYRHEHWMRKLIEKIDSDWHC